MPKVKPAWNLGSCLMTTVVPTSSRHWWAPWRQPRGRRWSTSRASCFYRASTTTLKSSCSKNEAKVWTWRGSLLTPPKYRASAVCRLVTELLSSVLFFHVQGSVFRSNSTLAEPAGMSASGFIWFHCVKQNHIKGFQRLNSGHIHSFRWRGKVLSLSLRHCCFINHGSDMSFWYTFKTINAQIRNVIICVKPSFEYLFC